MELAEARRLSALAFAAELEVDGDARTVALGDLISREPFDRAFEVAQRLSAALPSERAVAAHLLRQLYEVRPQPSIVAAIVEMIDNERDPTVVAPLITALSWTRQLDHLPVVLRYKADKSELVRWAVSDGLSCFAPDQRAASALVDLAHDIDTDVRWSAVYEIGAWVSEMRLDEMVSVLSEAAEHDPDKEVREAAADALATALRR